MSLCCLLAGPFVGFVLNRVGSRLTVMMASIVMCSGFIAASFAQSILHLVLTHGLVSGILSILGLILLQKYCKYENTLYNLLICQFNFNYKLVIGKIEIYAKTFVLIGYPDFILTRPKINF